jgi:hypothetical protein
MTKILFAAGTAVIVLAGVGLVTVPLWALALAGGAMGTALFPRRARAGDGEVSC